jgi:hypothetical protein
MPGINKGLLSHWWMIVELFPEGIKLGTEIIRRWNVNRLTLCCWITLPYFHTALIIQSLYFRKADFMSSTSALWFCRLWLWELVFTGMTPYSTAYVHRNFGGNIAISSSAYKVLTLKMEAAFPTETSVKSTRLQGVTLKWTVNFIRPVRNFVQLRFNAFNFRFNHFSALTSANN